MGPDVCRTRIWLRGVDLNHRPSGYEPDELPDCSTPRRDRLKYDEPGFAPAGAEERPHEDRLACRANSKDSPALPPRRHAARCDVRRVGREASRAAAVSPTAPPGTSGALDEPQVDPREPYRFGSHREFLYLFAAVSRSLKDPEDYARLAREFVEDALGHGVIYGELFVSPSVWTFFQPELDVRATMEAVVAELREARPRATFRLLPDLTRNFGVESAMAMARAAAEMSDLDVIGVSLGGDEQRFPARLFAEPFAYARAHGLHGVAHAGEADGAASVRDALELLGAERIGHGIRALEDPKVVELLAERRAALEICPTSNRLTGVALQGHPHPYEDFDRRLPRDDRCRRPLALRDLYYAGIPDR